MSPTIKQKKAMEKTLENGGNVTAGMRAAGYKEATVNNPGNLTKSKGWIELMTKHFPDTKLAERHAAMLDRKLVISGKNSETGELEVLETEHIDVNSVKAGLDMAYKIKRRYTEEVPVTNVLNIFSGKSEEELLAIIAGTPNA